ncbi:MAG: hypothetical protein DMG32_10160 [Acidobacteria bacterium]|nr:MAG: hypothetical protein DMG32_10160 [Acidobacteriota bacterium]
MYVVIGATGHTGSVVAEKLLAKGEKVRVVGRDARRLERLKQKGAEAFVADVTDASAMARLPQVSVIQSLGNMGGPVRPDLGLSMIATHDIGAFAAEALSRRDFEGKQRRELLGARDITYTEVAKVVGATIGKPDLTYQQVPPAQLKPALTQMGMSPNMADLLLEMSDALNSGHMRALEPRSAENTTPTTIETFVAEVFVPAYRAKAARA